MFIYKMLSRISRLLWKPKMFHPWKLEPSAEDHTEIILRDLTAQIYLKIFKLSKSFSW